MVLYLLQVLFPGCYLRLGIFVPGVELILQLGTGSGLVITLEFNERHGSARIHVLGCPSRPVLKGLGGGFPVGGTANKDCIIRAGAREPAVEQATDRVLLSVGGARIGGGSHNILRGDLITGFQVVFLREDFREHNL